MSIEQVIQSIDEQIQRLQQMNRVDPLGHLQQSPAPPRGGGEEGAEEGKEEPENDPETPEGRNRELRALQPLTPAEAQQDAENAKPGWNDPETGVCYVNKMTKEEAERLMASSQNDATTYQTYTKPNLSTGEVYSGMTSGTGTPEQNLARRDSSHQKDAEGYGPARLDKSSSNRDAIRG